MPKQNCAFENPELGRILILLPRVVRLFVDSSNYYWITTVYSTPLGAPRNF